MRPLETELLDPLTGTYSRASLKHRLQEEVDRAIRYGQPFTILLLDLDHFKSVNDAFGHRRGDDILIALAKRLQAQARKSDVVFRYGGDEFILLLPSTEKEAAVLLAARLFDALTTEEYPGNPSIKLTSSMGVASFPEDADTPEGLFDTADKRHYQAKRLGRNRIVSGETENPAAADFDLAPRVIERELSLEKIYAFFENLSGKKQGTLSISGPHGVGKTRFLEEIAKIARLHGHHVISLSGKRSRKLRALGALLEAERNWDNLVSISNGEYAFIRGLDQLLTDKGNIGVVFTIDNLVEIDQQSLSTIERIFYSSSLPRVAIAYSDGDDSNLPYFTESPLVESVSLSAFNEEGVLVWLRHVLQWEPPETFVRWLHDQTRGLPDRLRKSLILLSEQGFLVFNEHWELQEETTQGSYQNFPLSVSLQRERNISSSNLLTDVPTFIGRNSELNRLKQLLRESHVVSVIGPGGIGKSRLALQAAIELEEEFEDGAFVINISESDLGRFEEPLTQLVSTLTANLNFSPSGTADMEAQIIRFFSGKQILLMINGHKNLHGFKRLINEITREAPKTRVLLTSTEPVNIDGEQVIELRGLAIPSSDSIGAARHFEAVQLFLVHARRADPEFTLTDHNLPFVIKICRLVGGMPLGIELAAVWVSMFSPEELAAQIEFNARFLASESSGEILEKQNIQAVFDYFWGLLSETEQVVLSKLTTFQNDFSSEAALKVAGASPFFLAGLTDRVFLTRTASDTYQMHPLLRQYAALKLAEDPASVNEAQRAHSAFYLDFLQSRTNHLRGKRQGEAQDAIGAIFPSIQTAWNWAIQNRQYELIQDSVDALFMFCENRGSFREADIIFGAAVSLMEEYAPGPTGDMDGYRSAFSRLKLRAAIFRSTIGFIKEAKKVIEACLVEAEAGGDLEEIALCNERLGWVNYDLGLPHNDVKTIWHKSLAIYRERDIPWGVSRLLYNLSFISSVEETREMMQEKLKISTEIGDQIGLADSLLTLGEVHQKLGDAPQSFDYYRRCREIYEQLGNQDGVAFSHFGRGDVFLNLGQYDTALACFETAQYLFRQTGNINGLSTSLTRICRAAIAMGDFGRAHLGLSEGLNLEQGAGSRIGTAYTLNYQGELAMIEGDLEKARKKLEKSCKIIRDAEDSWGLGRVLATLSRLAILEGKFEEAGILSEEGLSVSRKMGETSFIHANLLAMAHAFLGAGNTSKAEILFREALLLADDHNFPPLILDALLGYGRLLKHLDHPQTAEPLLKMIQANPASSFPTSRDADALLADSGNQASLPDDPKDLGQIVNEILAWRSNA